MHVSEMSIHVLLIEVFSVIVFVVVAALLMSVVSVRLFLATFNNW